MGKKLLFYFLLMGTLAIACSPVKKQLPKPNVLLIIADDLGYGDVSAYGNSKINTPNIDILANEGVTFTDGHATSATCTPSRYALFTGQYPWKNKNAKILPGDAPLLIGENQFTMGKMFQSKGYKTAAIGKWHLGMGKGHPDWNKKVIPGAKETGFDYSYIIAATCDRVPTAFIEDGNVANLAKGDSMFVDYQHPFPGEPTAITNPELMTKLTWTHGHNNTVINGIPRIGYMKGGRSACWVDENIADTLLFHAEKFVTENKDQQFFLYYGLHEPHVPRVPNQRFAGKSGMGLRGDAIMEADWCVGEILAHLKKEGVLDNTLVIFSSDNGPVLDDGYDDKARELLNGDDPSGGFRGGKYSLFEAGTRVPFFIYWKGHIKHIVSDAAVNQIDLVASLAKLVGAEIPSGLDSKDFLKTFMGKNKKGRKSMIMEANQRLALRSGNYDLIPPYKGPKTNETGNELANFQQFTLFNIKKDPAQKKELQDEKPEILKQLKEDFLTKTKGYYNSKQKEIRLK